jgi:hypothetical protein
MAGHPIRAGMEVRDGEDESSVGELLGLVAYVVPVLNPDASVDDQPGVSPDEDSDVRDQRDVTVAQHVDAGGNLDRWGLGDERGARQARDVFDLLCL